MRAAEYPAAARISSVCWPSVGGGRRMLAGCADSLIGEPRVLNVPATGCVISTTISRAATWGCPSAAGTVLTGPAGTPAALSRAVHSAHPRAASALAMRGISVSRLRTRSGLDA